MQHQDNADRLQAIQERLTALDESIETQCNLWQSLILDILDQFKLLI